LRGSDSCRWCPSWSDNGGGLNHEAHKGHEQRGRRAWVRTGWRKCRPRDPTRRSL
jgi:hypothetical protein